MRKSNNNRHAESRLRLTATKSNRKKACDATSRMTSSASSSVTSGQKTVTSGRASTSTGSLLVPEILARVAVPVYLFTITATWVLGVVEVAPYLYRHHPPFMLLFQRLLMTFLYLQMTFNWLCIRYVDSSYSALLKARWLRREKEKVMKEEEKEKEKKEEKGEEKEKEAEREREGCPQKVWGLGGGDGGRRSQGEGEGDDTHDGGKQSPGEEKEKKEEKKGKSVVVGGTVPCSEKPGEDTPSLRDSRTSLSHLHTSEKDTSPEQAPAPPTSSSSSTQTQEEISRKELNPGKQDDGKDCDSSPHVPNTPTSAKSPWKPEFRPPRGQTTFPYWSWAPCYICQVLRPPRCHHCSECNTCVLKRDHHCYFAGNCVGYKNQRHFLVFGAWAFFSCCYATSHAMPYLFSHMWPHMRWCDLVAPVTVLRAALGYVSPLIALNMCVQTLLFYFLLLSLNFVVEHVDLIARGLTSFEIRGLKKNVEVKDARDVAGRFRAVLGKNWGLNLLCPLHWLWEAEEDPEHWPSITFIRH